jgi:hypothetical protein
MTAYLSPHDLSFLLRWKTDRRNAAVTGKNIPVAVTDPRPVARRTNGRIVMLEPKWTS